MSNKKNQSFSKLPTPACNTKHATHSHVNRIERWLLNKLLQLMGNPQLCFELWDGSKITGNSAISPLASIVIANRKTLWRLLANPGLNFGDDFSVGLIDIEGDLVQLLEAIHKAGKPYHKSSFFERLAINRPAWMRRNTLAGSKRNIHHHYDLGNAFYRLWLDQELAYTCAYFPDPSMSLEAAQLAKMEHICQKLRLRAGETVVEAGCGWGALALYMARYYGVNVRAYNVSQEQIKYARVRAEQEGLQGQVEYIEEDYRDINGVYDAFVSVGMLEHVGRPNHAKLGAVIDRCLSPTGRGLIHSISQNEARPVNAWLEHRIFPGGYPPTLREIAAILEPRACVVVNVENLRQHYAKTLEHWLARFEQHVEQITTMYDESFVRAWRLYLAGSIANFATNSLQLYQVLFTRTAQTDTPWTRAYLYDDVSAKVERYLK